MTRILMTEGEFYAGRRDRERSPELDYGVHWRGTQDWPRWRVTFVDATGELYAVELTGHGREGAILEVLGRFRDRGHAEKALEGWADVCEGPASLEWVRQRVAEHGLPIEVDA